MEQFVHLHNHTEFSLLDGAAKITQLVKETKNRGWKAVAITDHGNMYGALQFYTACLENGIKPIIGCEFYVADDYKNKHGKQNFDHLILLAKNNTGYKNLLKLNSIAFLEGFYYKPRIDYNLLEKYSDGLICLSACLAGRIPKLILEHRLEDAEKFAIKLNNMFGGEDFYLEIQNHGIPEEDVVRREIIKLSQKLNIKLVATNDCHYIEKEDAEMQDVLMCVQMGKTLDDPDRFKFSTQEFYYKTYDEMKALFAGHEEALLNTLEIADKCDVVIRRKVHTEMGLDERYCLPANENYIPKYVPENSMSTFEYMKFLTYRNLDIKYPNASKEVLDRIEYELNTIHEQGFVEYFLVVWDYINWAKNNGISVGPGRGSGAGSVVAYLMGITDVEPIKYSLFFERFINKERVSMPDFDVDFDSERRGEVIEYVKRKYHPENVSNIITFGKMQAKNAIKDVGRVLRIPYSDTDRITKLIPNRLPEGIKKPPVLAYYFGKTGKKENDKYIMQELKDIYDSDTDLRRVVDIAIKLEGFPRNTSMHACGVLIAPEPVDEFVPEARNGEDVTTQYDMIELESLGLLKMDFLGLVNLVDIDLAKKYIKELHGVDIDFHKIGYEDKKVYELISTGNTMGIFQLESAGFQNFMRELQPDGLEDIIAGVSLYRPGPMDSIPTYVRNKFHPEEVKYPHECIKDVLKVTYGVIVYQEQVMQIFQIMGGYSLGQADNVRRIMGKKKVDKMAYEKDKFINGWEDPKGLHSIPGAVKLGVPRETAEKVFHDMESFAQYAFNKSHATAYAMITYQTAYLKCYYEVEFLTAIINNRITKADEIKTYVTYARSENIEVLPPNINKSQTYFSVENGNIRYGLSGLKGVGVSAISTILKERENGDFKDLYDFISRIMHIQPSLINKKSMESLIFSGALDCFGLYRSQLNAMYDTIIEKVEKDIERQKTGQFSLFENFEPSLGKVDEVPVPKIKEFTPEAKLKFEKSILGVYMSGHPLEKFADRWKDYNFNASMITENDDQGGYDEDDDSEETGQVYTKSAIEDGTKVKCGGIITEVKRIITKVGNKPMAVVHVEDIYGTFVVMVVPKYYDQYKDLLKEDDIIEIYGRFSERPGKDAVIMAEKISELKQEENTVTDVATVYLKYNLNDSKIYDKINLILSLYPGESTVMVRSTADNKAYKQNKKVNASNYLYNELVGVLGEENVIIK